jgi:hypothetical protein
MRSWVASTGTALCHLAILPATFLAATPACADEPETPRSPAPPLAVAGLPRPPTAPDPAQLEEAKRHMKAGASFYKDPSGHKCEEALREFRKAYELSGSINAVKGMAVCDLELERDGESIALYTAYLAGKHDTIDPAERAQVEADLATLRAAVARVSLTTNVDQVRLIDVRTPSRGYPVRNTYPLSLTGARLGVHPGQHVFTASVDGAPEQVWKVDIGNGGSYAHAFVFSGAGAGTPPVDDGEPIRPIPPSVFATAGLTVALAVPWGVFAIRAKSMNDTYQGVNGKEPLAQLNDLHSDIKSLNLIADLFLGATLTSLTATAVLFFTRPTVKRAGNFTPAPPRVMLGVSSGGAVASGWF